MGKETPPDPKDLAINELKKNIEFLQEEIEKINKEIVKIKGVIRIA